MNCMQMNKSLRITKRSIMKITTMNTTSTQLITMMNTIMIITLICTALKVAIRIKNRRLENSNNKDNRVLSMMTKMEIMRKLKA